ncbi:MAG: hypothetical protein HC778_02785 [Chamaesiphon sp. CSU_1_12]|nr:hypothetical protein [Chamaesiphon sp. CSU_1_12]
MSSKKITDADKLEIVDLYRQSGETTASLASRYGVSNSTISRLLKTTIPEAEYEILIQQKRGSKASGEEESLTTDELTDVTLPPTPAIESQPEPEEVFAPEIDSAEPTLCLRQAKRQRERAEPVITSLQTDEPDLSPPAIPSEPERDLDATPVNTSAEDRAANQRRVRRRPSAPVTMASEETIASASQSATIANIDVPPSTVDIAAVQVSTSKDLDEIAPTPTKTIVPPTHSPHASIARHCCRFKRSLLSATPTRSGC